MQFCIRRLTQMSNTTLFDSMLVELLKTGKINKTDAIALSAIFQFTITQVKPNTDIFKPTPPTPIQLSFIAQYGQAAYDRLTIYAITEKSNDEPQTNERSTDERELDITIRQTRKSC